MPTQGGLIPLQWGRDAKIAERAACLTPCATSSRFNGAATQESQRGRNLDPGSARLPGFQLGRNPRIAESVAQDDDKLGVIKLQWCRNPRVAERQR